MVLLGCERRWLLMVFDAIVPKGEGDGILLGARDVPMGRFLDDLFRSAPAHFCLGLKACIWFVTFAPVFVIGKFRTFGGLAAADRLRLLEKLGESDVYVVREMPLLFKTVACLAFCGLPEVQTRVGIAPVDPSPPAWARRALHVVRPEGSPR